MSKFTVCVQGLLTISILGAVSACDNEPSAPLVTIWLQGDRPTESERFELEGPVRFWFDQVNGEEPGDPELRLTIRTENQYPFSSCFSIVAVTSVVNGTVKIDLKYVVQDKTVPCFRSPDHAWVIFGLTMDTNRFSLIFTDGVEQDAFTVESKSGAITVSPDTGSVAIPGEPGS